MPEINNTNRAIFDALSLAQREQLYESASQLFSPHKRQLFDKLVLNRTRHICVVLEDIFQPHNASAVLRSCDFFGVQASTSASALPSPFSTSPSACAPTPPSIGSSPRSNK